MENENFIKVFRPRGHHYGTPRLISFIKETTSLWKKLDPSTERLQIGDLSAKSGGKIFRHVSHQNGLDADIVYLRKDKRETKPRNKKIIGPSISLIEGKQVEILTSKEISSF